MTTQVSTGHATNAGADGAAADDAQAGQAFQKSLIKTNGASSYVASGASEVVHGTAGNEKIEGKQGDDKIRGGAGDDVLRGNAGDDYLIGGKGNDTLRGGNGTDTVRLQGARADWEFSRTAEGYVQAHNTATGETDILRQIEIIAFQDPSTKSFSDKVDMSSLVPDAPATTGGTGGDAPAIVASSGVGTGIKFSDLFTSGAIDLPQLPAGPSWDAPQAQTPAAKPPASNSASSTSPSTHTAPPAYAPPPSAGGSGAALKTSVAPVGGNQSNVTGSLFGDNLRGTASNDHIRALTGGDQVAALGGNDVIVGGSGNDVIDGGTGVDRVIQFGSVQDYMIRNSAEGVVLVRKSSGEQDVLKSIEYVTFQDGTFTTAELLAKLPRA